jgi:hypothetical protein
LVSFSGLQLTSPSSGLGQFFAFSDFNRKSGDALSGIYEQTQTISEFAENGEWEIEYVDLGDIVGNFDSLNTGELDALGFDTTVTIDTQSGDDSLLM